MNHELHKIFSELAALYAIKEIPFKPRAYEYAASSIGGLEEDIKDIYKKGGQKALVAIPGIGQGIAEKIEEYITTHHIKEYDKLKKAFPVDIDGLLRIEGLGPKGIQKLYESLKIKNIRNLEMAAKRGKLGTIPGFGEKTEQKILQSIARLEQYKGRFLLGTALPIAHKIIKRLRALKDIEKAEYAGSLRRMQETIGDIDILVISDAPAKVMEYFVKMPEVKDIIAQGPTKTSVRLNIGINADLRVLTAESFGAAWQYFTGDKFHNVELRTIAIDKGYKLNEYGLFKGQKAIAGTTETSIYEALGMAWIPPELRTQRGEIEAAQHNTLPHLIAYDDLKGDLQVQTDWTDGADSIEDMATAAQKMGLEYIVITDHTKSLAMTSGSDEKKLKKQMAAIDSIQKKFPDIKILKGAEVNILKDGSLDIDDDTLSQLDVVGASVHSHFSMEEKDMTQRIVRAMENPNVDIIFHSTGRVIHKREPYKIDIDAIIKAAHRTKTILEIDAQPERLDLKDDYIRKAIDQNIKLSIDSDAHDAESYHVLEYGIGQARRGWATKKDIINTRSWHEMLNMLK